MTDTNSSIRLNKFLAQQGVASRRGADTLVFDGRVHVNGVVADSPGIKVAPGDTVEVDGKPIASTPQDEPTVILLHKPIQTVTTASDPQGRKTVLDLLPRNLRHQRPFPVGRLDYFSEGLLLLTTDGDLCYRLTHPKWHLPKTYLVVVRGRVPKSAIRTMQSGMTLREGEKLAPVKVKTRQPKQNSQVLEMTLIQGINRQIRRMCRDLDLTILKLKRISMGPIRLGPLNPGEHRVLSRDETRDLRRAVGLN